LLPHRRRSRKSCNTNTKMPRSNACCNAFCATPPMRVCCRAGWGC